MPTSLRDGTASLWVMTAIETHALTKDYGARRGARVEATGRWRPPALADLDIVVEEG